jgi:hypothetical protein
MVTQAIQYWDVRINREGACNPFDLVLNVYLVKSDVDSEAHNKTIPMQECIRQLNFSRQRLKDVVTNANEHRRHYEVKIADKILEKRNPRNPRNKDGEIFDPVETESLWKRRCTVVLAQNGLENPRIPQTQHSQMEQDQAHQSCE